MAIDNAGMAIYQGKLRAADVGWISIHDEKEYIILPTTFHQFKEMKQNQIEKRDWIINSKQTKVYTTKQYISNKNAFCPYSDNIINKYIPNYDLIYEDYTIMDLISKSTSSYATKQNLNLNCHGSVTEEIRRRKLLATRAASVIV